MPRLCRPAWRRWGSGPRTPRRSPSGWRPWPPRCWPHTPRHVPAAAPSFAPRASDGPLQGVPFSGLEVAVDRVVPPRPQRREAVLAALRDDDPLGVGVVLGPDHHRVPGVRIDVAGDPSGPSVIGAVVEALAQRIPAVG